MKETPFVLESHDGASIACYRWEPDDPSSLEGGPKAVVQIAHGASEHAARYRRFAEALVDAGYVAFGDDHRAHGRTAEEFGAFGIARPGGWFAMIEDLRSINEHIAAEYPGVPIVLFGHSMGSMMAQRYLQKLAGGLSALVLSGTTGGLGLDQDTLDMVVAIGAGEQADAPSEIFAAMFAGFNEPFVDGTHDGDPSGAGGSGFEWLSRDPVEVQRYVDDPWCGEPLSNGFVADMLSGTSSMWRPESESAIRKDLPIYVMSGDHDPVGGPEASSVRELCARYEELGAGPVTLKLYEGARHELLNETNRDQVTDELISWLDQVCGS